MSNWELLRRKAQPSQVLLVALNSMGLWTLPKREFENYNSPSVNLWRKKCPLGVCLFLLLLTLFYEFPQPNFIVSLVLVNRLSLKVLLFLKPSYPVSRIAIQKHLIKIFRNLGERRFVQQ